MLGGRLLEREINVCVHQFRSGDFRVEGLDNKQFLVSSFQFNQVHDPGNQTLRSITRVLRMFLYIPLCYFDVSDYHSSIAALTAELAQVRVRRHFTFARLPTGRRANCFTGSGSRRGVRAARGPCGAPCRHYEFRLCMVRSFGARGRRRGRGGPRAQVAAGRARIARALWPQLSPCPRIQGLPASVSMFGGKLTSRPPCRLCSLTLLR